VIADDCIYNDAALLKFDMPEVIFGQGALHKIGECAKRLGGERVFVVTDPGVIAVGWLDEALKHLEREGLSYVVYSNVVTNPRDFQVHAGAQLYLQKQCDVVVAVGGGSPIDTGKGVAILASNHGNIHDFEGCNRVIHPLPPMVCAPTTAGTGADVTQFAVVTDTVRRVKMTILSRAIMPDISLIDPRLLQTKPPDLIAATGMDTLTHAIEAFVSSLSWSLTDPHAFHAVELVFRYLPEAVRTRSMEALTALAIACLEAGIAFSNAILGAVHALAHPLGGLYDIHHGLANSILLPVVIRQNLDHSLEKYAHLAKATGAYRPSMSRREAALSLIDSIESLVAEIGLPNKLSQVGVKKEDLAPMAALAQQDVCLFTNPCPYNAAELAALYLEAW
jgi:1,3-propanediol dehydrogenase